MGNKLKGKRLKVILCCYNWAGCQALKLLYDKGYDLFVYTSESEYYIPSVIDYCKKLNIKYTTEKIQLENLPFKPDIICSIYYRYIISKDVIELCNGKIFNLHPALLPKYRGCSSLTWAMINGEKNVGYTYHYIDSKIDNGRILIQKQIELLPFDTQDTLYKRVMFEAMKDFNNAFQLVIKGFNGIKQIGTPTFYKRGCPYNGIINPEWNIEKIERFIRAMIAPPLPLCKYKTKDIHSLVEYINEKNKENL